MMFHFKKLAKHQAKSMVMIALPVGLFLHIPPSVAADVPEARIQEHRKIRAVEPTVNVSTNSNANSSNSSNDSNSNSYSTLSNTVQASGEDSMAVLIRASEKKYLSNQLQIEQRTRIRTFGDYSNPQSVGIIINNLDFKQWLNVSPYRISEVAEYQKYLAKYVGVYNVPPMKQLLTTARSWQECGYYPYQIPPRYLWSNMINTLKLYSALKSQGVLPNSTVIRSVYRSPELNECAGGAPASKHMTNGAMDVWVPEYDGDPWYTNPMHNRLCEFWSVQGERYDFGLGIYAKGSIHIDTQGYRRWGVDNTAEDSICRFVE